LPACVPIIRLAFGTIAKEFHLTEENYPTNGAFIREERLLSEFDQGVKCTA